MIPSTHFEYNQVLSRRNKNSSHSSHSKDEYKGKSRVPACLPYSGLNLFRDDRPILIICTQLIDLFSLRVFRTLEIHLMARLLVFCSLDDILFDHLSVPEFILKGDTMCRITRPLALNNLVASVDSKVSPVGKVANG